MKRMAVVLAATGIAVAGMGLPAQADEPVMVTVCHATGNANSGDSDNRYDWTVGHELVVPEKAYLRAFANQGDVLKSSFASGFYMTPEHDWWDTLADVDGKLTSATCAYRY